jgi:hypothetical protein
MWMSTRWVRIHQLLPGSFALFSMIVRSTGLLPAPFDLSFANVTGRKTRRGCRFASNLTKASLSSALALASLASPPPIIEQSSPYLRVTRRHIWTLDGGEPAASAARRSACSLQPCSWPTCASQGCSQLCSWLACASPSFSLPALLGVRASALFMAPALPACVCVAAVARLG